MMYNLFCMNIKAIPAKKKKKGRGPTVDDSEPHGVMTD